MGCLLLYFTIVRSPPLPSCSTPLRRRFFPVRCCRLPFSKERAKYHKELEAAISVVERASRLCVDVQRSLLSTEGRIIEKNDNTPVTIADFGVQALVSLELGRLFPSIPLVAEEDSGFIRSNNLVDSVVSVVIDKASSEDKPSTDADVLEAIDRGGRNAIVYGNRPATYWILDPIDGTRGFVRGREALYVVGLALVVDGEIVLGIMGCPNWQESTDGDVQARSGLIMVAHVGCGTWRRLLVNEVTDHWTRCYVDVCQLVPKRRFCIPDSQTWESLPLSASFAASTDANDVKEKEILLLPTCCGSLCKYMMVASGRASVFILRAKAQTIIKAWDHAVGVICVHEAGGKVTDWNESQLDFAADKVERRIIFPSGGVLVSNGNIHDQILKMISSSSSII